MKDFEAILGLKTQSPREQKMPLGVTVLVCVEYRNSAQRHQVHLGYLSDGVQKASKGGLLLARVFTDQDDTSNHHQHVDCKQGQEVHVPRA